MDAQKFAAMPLRPWIAPAFGAGLLIAGLAMIVGLSSRFGPFVFIAVAGVILSVGHFRTKQVTPLNLPPGAQASDETRRPVDN